jgi:hypothetical protein
LQTPLFRVRNKKKPDIAIEEESLKALNELGKNPEITRSKVWEKFLLMNLNILLGKIFV